jgi:hypothetical protein
MEAYESITKANPIVKNFKLIIERIETIEELKELNKSWDKLLFNISPNASIRGDLKEFLDNYLFYVFRANLEDDVSNAMHRLLGTNDDIYVAVKPKLPQENQVQQNQEEISKGLHMQSPNEYFFLKKVHTEQGVEDIQKEEFLKYLEDNEVEEDIISKLRDNKDL